MRCEPPYTDFSGDCFDYTTLGGDIPEILKPLTGLNPAYVAGETDIEQAFSGVF